MVITSVSKTLAMIDQLIIGLSSFGVLDKLRNHRKILEPLLTLDGAANFFISADLQLDYLTVECSPEGSNRKPLEVDVHKYFCDYIQEVATRTGICNSNRYF